MRSVKKPPYSLTEVTENNIGSTLVAHLTPCVDIVRNIATVLGARQYRVDLVWIQWSGGERGVGNENPVAIQPILPTPMVAGLDSIRADLQSFGLTEMGELRVTQISPRFSEDLLMGRDIVTANVGDDLPDDIGFFWEITFPGDREQGIRRRFTPKAPPSKHSTKFEWSINLLRASEDRARNGDPG